MCMFVHKYITATTCYMRFTGHCAEQDKVKQ